jgi:Mrp family chromosome partitioning ATPase
MPTKDEIKAAILKKAGNPTVGVIADMADELAKAVWELENKNSENPAKEVRVIESKETR